MHSAGALVLLPDLVVADLQACLIAVQMVKPYAVVLWGMQSSQLDIKGMLILRWRRASHDVKGQHP